MIRTETSLSVFGVCVRVEGSSRTCILINQKTAEEWKICFDNFCTLLAERFGEALEWNFPRNSLLLWAIGIQIILKWRHPVFSASYFVTLFSTRSLLMSGGFTKKKRKNVWWKALNVFNKVYTRKAFYKQPVRKRWKNFSKNNLIDRQFSQNDQIYER